MSDRILDAKILDAKIPSGPLADKFLVFCDADRSAVKAIVSERVGCA